AALASPSAALARAVPPDTLLCRCEDVSYEAVNACLADEVAPNAIKLATRVGMGPCQGRSCEVSLLRAIATRTGRPVDDIAGSTARFPARPTRIGDLLRPGFVAPKATK